MVGPRENPLDRSRGRRHAIRRRRRRSSLYVASPSRSRAG